MGDRTSIEWTRGDDGSPGATWNPMTGCTEVSPGCDHCYAATFAERWRGTPGHYFERGFDVQLRPAKLDLPLRWKRPRRIFVNSMSDLWHDKIPDDYIANVFAVMALAEHHTFQVLTKRHARMRSLLTSSDFRTAVAEHMLGMTSEEQLPDVVEVWPLPNVHLGVSAENQQWANIRIPALLQTPAAVHWVSAEPLLGPIDLFGEPGGEEPGPGIVRTAVSWMHPEYGVQDEWDDQVGLDWVVVGGESGRGARRMELDWARSLRDQCASADVPFLFKQLGSVLAKEWGCKGKGEDPDEWPEDFPRQYPVERKAGV